MLVNVVYALLLTGSWEGIRGMGAWVKKSLGATPPWIMAAEAHAKSRWGTMIQWLEGCPSHSLPFHLLPLPPHPLLPPSVLPLPLIFLPLPLSHWPSFPPSPVFLSSPPSLSYSYETACEEYIKALDLLHSPEDSELGPSQKTANAPIINFIVNRVCTRLI